MALVGTSLNRPEVKEHDISQGVVDIVTKLKARLDKKGRGSYASRHEILGILEEEFLEAKEAIRKDGQEGYDEYTAELLDIAVGGLFGYICLKYGYITP